MAELRRAALEAGIMVEASDAAFQTLQTEQAGARTHPTGPDTKARVPWWVRFCLFGVPDRRSAMTFYWVFVATLFALPVLGFAGVDAPLVSIPGLLFAAFAPWSMSAAVKWTDARGWDLDVSDAGMDGQ